MTIAVSMGDTPGTRLAYPESKESSVVARLRINRCSRASLQAVRRVGGDEVPSGASQRNRRCQVQASRTAPSTRSQRTRGVHQQNLGADRTRHSATATARASPSWQVDSLARRIRSMGRYSHWEKQPEIHCMSSPGLEEVAAHFTNRDQYSTYLCKEGDEHVRIDAVGPQTTILSLIRMRFRHASIDRQWRRGRYGHAARDTGQGSRDPLGGRLGAVQ